MHGAQELGAWTGGALLVRLANPLDGASQALAANAQLGESWVQILPPGTVVEARDKRRFTVSDAAAVVSNTELPMLVDWEHNSETRGGDTRAAGWVEELSAEHGPGVWGRVRWTPKGRGDAASQDYRFISPVVVGKRDQQGMFHVERMASIALTNRPALRMAGIEMLREQMAARVEERTNMDLKLMLTSALSLPADSTDAQIGEAFKSAVAKTGDAAALRQVVDTLTSERNEAVSKLSELQTQLSAVRATSFKSEVESFFDNGGREGKIPPAAREKWLAFALESEDKFRMFREVVYPGLPTVALSERAPSSKPPKPKRRDADNPHRIDRAALRAYGFTDEQIAESERDVFGRKGSDDDDDDDDDDDGEDASSEGQG